VSDAGEPASWVEVSRSPARRTALEHALVLQARSIGHGILEQDGALCVLVHADDAARAREELARYAQENAAWPPPAAALGSLSEGALGALLFGVTLSSVAFLAGKQAFGIDWLARGRNDAQAVLDGELWRVVTALSLHADLAHLLSNLFFGGLFVFLACEVLGAGFGLCAIGLAGALGNLLNALLREPEHTSIGASTAVFGALGLLVAHQWKTRKLTGFNRGRLLPVVAGCVLLGMLGMGGERVDVIAHVTGFLAGGALGLAAGTWPWHRGLSSFAQSVLVVAAPAALAVAWMLAFA
jgi:membrane associated rhomboid family serine protease